MTAPRPQVQFRLYHIPDGVTYRDSYWNEQADTDAQTVTDAFTALEASRTGARNLYTYLPDVTMDYWLRGASGDPYTLLATIDDATSFTANFIINDICTWSITKEFRVGDTAAAELFNAARTPGTWSAWHISTDDDPPRTIEKFLQGDLLQEPTQISPLLFRSSPTPIFSNEAGTPDFLARGGGGPVQRVSARITERGLQVTISGTCWAKTMQQTVHLNDVSPLPASTQSGFLGFRQLVSGILTANAEYEIPQLTDAEIALLGSDLLGDATFRSDLETAGIDAETAFRTKTPVAIFTIITAVRTSALNHLRANYNDTPFLSIKGGIVQPGSHSVLRSFQRLAERTGLLFNTRMPVILWDAPSATTIEWGPGDYYDWAPDFFTPQATAWVTPHVDGLRNWDVYTPDVGLIADWGEIQASNLSTAARPLAEDADFFVAEDITPADLLPNETADEAAKRLSGEFIIQSVKAQNAALALTEANNFSLAVDLKWQEGTRFGLDWNLGSRVRVRDESGIVIPDEGEDGLVARSARISMTKAGTWEQIAGVGPRPRRLSTFKRQREVLE